MLLRFLPILLLVAALIFSGLTPAEAPTVIESPGTSISEYRQIEAPEPEPEPLIFEATAYTWTGQRTASGTWPAVGTVATDPEVIPLGTKLWVEGYGEAVAEDTGGAVKGNIIDVYLDTESECWQWGRRMVEVRILE